MKNLKTRLQQGETIHGCWLNLASATTAEIVGLAGFDWVLIDLEHGLGTETEALAQMQSLSKSSAGILVRVESPELPRIQRMLDMGAEGVMCPKVNDVSEAKKLATALHYPPVGQRGVAKMVRATQFGHNFDEYYRGSKENILGIAQIETKQALENVEAIAEVEGVDVLFIGPADLTMDLGIFGQFDNPIYLDAVRATVNAAKKSGKSTGTLFFNVNEYEKYHGMGMRFLACGSDGAFVVNGAKQIADALAAKRSAITKP